jgi:hypothetical protein
MKMDKQNLLNRKDMFEKQKAEALEAVSYYDRCITELAEQIAEIEEIEAMNSSVVVSDVEDDVVDAEYEEIPEEPVAEVNESQPTTETVEPTPEVVDEVEYVDPTTNLVFEPVSEPEPVVAEEVVESTPESTVVSEEV